jgi:hypothetical protein
MAAAAGWVNNGNLDDDLGLVGIDRAAGMLTGWFQRSRGGTCNDLKSQTHHNASYPAENCPLAGLHDGRDMYYWYMRFDDCPGNQLQLNTTPGCYNAVWGGMSGSSAYYISGSNRYIRAVVSTSNRSTWAKYCRLWNWWIDTTNNTFIPQVRGSSFDLQALDMNAAPSTIQAGSKTTLLNHLATNPTNGSSSYATRTFRVYLSSNDNITTGDTLLGTQTYNWSFAPMNNVRVNMAQVTIPSNTPPGYYFIGVIYNSSTDSNYGNNDTTGWDAASILVTEASPPNLLFTAVTPCRIIDTRISAGGAGPIPGGTQRNFSVVGSCGVPSVAKALSINIASVNATGAGNLRAFAYGDAVPNTAVLNYGQIPGLFAITNAAVVPICSACTWNLSIFVSKTTDVVVDVMGYFAPL